MTATSSRRAGGVLADMARSLGLVFLFAAVVLFVGPTRQLVFPGHHDRITVVSYTAQVQAARELSRHPMLAPAGLATSWRATSARDGGGRGEPVTLHIGFVTPKGAYAGLEESDGPAHDFLVAQLGRRGADTVERTVEVAGARWSLRTAADGDRALTRDVGGTTVVVTGSAGMPELQALIGALTR